MSTLKSLMAEFPSAKGTTLSYVARGEIVLSTPIEWRPQGELDSITVRHRTDDGDVTLQWRARDVREQVINLADDGFVVVGNSGWSVSEKPDAPVVLPGGGKFAGRSMSNVSWKCAAEIAINLIRAGARMNCKYK
jgi:hypothetical protein